jgi:hypothetical protein
VSTPGKEIDAFLVASGTSHARSLDVAILFARSMSDELRVTLTQWEAAASALEEIRAELPSAADN